MLTFLGFILIKLMVIEFKKKINDEPITKFTVVETVESNYDFLFNSLIEKARSEEKGRK